MFVLNRLSIGLTVTFRLNFLIRFFYVCIKLVYELVHKQVCIRDTYLYHQLLGKRHAYTWLILKSIYRLAKAFSYYFIGSRNLNMFLREESISYENEIIIHFM